MSAAHPYRQKVSPADSPSRLQAPYPTADLVDSDMSASVPAVPQLSLQLEQQLTLQKSRTSSPKYSPQSYHSHSPQLQAQPQRSPQNHTQVSPEVVAQYHQSPGYDHQQYIQIPPQSSVIASPDALGLQARTFNHKSDASVGSSSSGSQSENTNTNTNTTAYYPQSPPPVFSNKTSTVISPSFRPHSANSSVTNLTLNGQSHGGHGQSLSQGHLSVAPHRSHSDTFELGPPNNIRYGHTRAVSSTSSFFNDKSDNVSMVDYSHTIIQQYLGLNLHRSVPRIKTLELYRQNAKKSNDPTVLFQYAQYMLQTALLMDEAGQTSPAQSSGYSSPVENSPKRDLRHKKSASSNSINNISLDDDTSSFATVSDKKLKKELLREALHYLRRLADKGYVDAQYLLADAHSSGALGKIENRFSFVLFQTAAKHGHVESAYRTSYCYEEGLGTGRDARKAIEYLKMAALKNHAAAMYKLGIYSFYGRMGLGDDTNTKKMGIKWLSRASNIATELTAAAPYELGKIHMLGFKDIVIPDEKYALELYSQAAALGHVELARILGQAYEIGEVLPQDSNLSIHYYTQAALGGNPESMLAMCAWYLVGSEPFLPKDELEAFEWAKRAAQSNFVKAQYALGNFYEKGVGCEKDVQQSQLWYKKAAEGGDEKSLGRILDKDWLAKFNKTRKNRKAVPTKSQIQNDSKNNQRSLNEKNSASEKDCVIV